MIKVKSKMMTEDEQEHIFKCGQVWRGYLSGKEVFVITEHRVCPTNLFDKFYDVIKVGIDKGLVKMLTLDQVKGEHLNKCFVEF